MTACQRFAHISPCAGEAFEFAELGAPAALAVPTWASSASTSLAVSPPSSRFASLPLPWRLALALAPRPASHVASSGRAATQSVRVTNNVVALKHANFMPLATTSACSYDLLQCHLASHLQLRHLHRLAPQLKRNLARLAVFRPMAMVASP